MRQGRGPRSDVEEEVTVLPRSSASRTRTGAENLGWGEFGRQMALFGQAGTTAPREQELARLLDPSCYPAVKGQTGERL